MSAEIIINATPHEKRVALRANGVLTEIYIERGDSRSLIGNIYKGKITRVLPGIQAAFVDIGLERTGFLFIGDVYLEGDHPAIDEEERKNSAITPVPLENSGNVLEPSKIRLNRKIQELFRVGDELIIQVIKDPIGSKGARLTTQITIPGRYLVYLPQSNHVAVSRRMSQEQERERLKKVVEGLRKNNEGFIIRTVAEHVEEMSLKEDINFLVKIWRNAQEKIAKARAPELIFEELDLILKSVRDLWNENITDLVLDSQKEYERINQFIKTYMSGGSVVARLYDKQEMIFDFYNIENEINRALSKRVWLKSGGYIVIDQTEALVVIDVNTGRFVGGQNFEETVFLTNLEAAKEIAHQLRLRNCGGIIIIDFIDMENATNRQNVTDCLLKELAQDKAKTTINAISSLGLVEMTRRRVRESLPQLMTEICHYCEGRGYLKSRQSICYEIFREIVRKSLSSGIKNDEIVIIVHSEVAALLEGPENQIIIDLEKIVLRKVIVSIQPTYHMEQYEVLV